MKAKDLKGKEISIFYESKNFSIENILLYTTINIVECDNDTYDEPIWTIYTDNDIEFVLNENEFKNLLNGAPAKIGGNYDAMLYIQIYK